MDKNSEEKGSKTPAISLDSKKLNFLEQFIQQNTKILNENPRISVKKKKSPSFQCKFCLKTFACSPSVSRHKKVCPLNENAKKGKPLVCHLCNNTFSRTDGLKVHLKRCSTTTLKKYKNCLYQNCDIKFYHKQALMQHLTNSHGQIFQKEIQKVFPNEQAFYAWKEKVEENTFSYFSKKNGKKANIQYFYCQQDGESKGATRKTKRKNSKGQIRTGKTCIASMKIMKLKNNAVLVKFQPMHCHVLKAEDLKHHPLSKNTYESINEQLSMGLSPKQIIKSLEGKSIPESDVSETAATRKNDFVTVHRIQGIARLRRVKLRADPDDSVSLTKIVQNLIEEPNNPIILFKAAKQETIIGPDGVKQFANSPDLFMLGIQTPEQQKVFTERAAEIVSINVAYGTNKYDYPLLTVMVPDEYHRGYPVAHFICNQMDTNALICFFLSLKNNNPSADVKCIITNDDPVLFEAAETVFGDHFRHLLCLFHVNLTFQNFLNNLAPVDHRQEMFSIINLLISSSDKEWFLNMFDDFISAFKDIAPEFTETFEKYRETADKWAMVHRNFPHGDVDTVLLNEAFLNRLKATCAKKKANWRLDDLATLLLEIQQDDFESREKENILGVPFGLSDPTNFRHEKGLAIPNKDVAEQFPNQWIVLSQTIKDKKYFVSKCCQVCQFDPCPYMCKNLLCYKLCVHLYFCTCTDKSPLCKHIHKVHSLLTKIISIPADGFTSSSFNIQEENVTFYEGNVVEAETIIDGTHSFETPVEEIFKSDLISLQPIEALNTEANDNEIEVCKEEESKEEFASTTIDETTRNLEILIKENILRGEEDEETTTNLEILIEENIVGGEEDEETTTSLEIMMEENIVGREEDEEMTTNFEILMEENIVRGEEDEETTTNLEILMQENIVGEEEDEEEDNKEGEEVEETLVEEIIVCDNDLDSQLEFEMDEASSLKLRIEENISKLTSILYQSNVSEDFLSRTHSSLQNLLILAQAQQK